MQLILPLVIHTHLHTPTMSATLSVSVMESFKSETTAARISQTEAQILLHFYSNHLI